MGFEHLLEREGWFKARFNGRCAGCLGFYLAGMPLYRAPSPVHSGGYILHYLAACCEAKASPVS